MKLERKRLSILSGIAAVAIGITTFSVAVAARKEDTTTVRVGFFPNITHAQALVGIKNGEFQKVIGKKNKLDWKQFNAGPSEVEALLSNSLDLGYIGPGPAVNAYIKSHGDIKIIANAADGGGILVARKGSNIKNIKDLKGKKVVVPQYGNTQDLLLRNLLKKNGLKDTTKGGTVEVLQADNPDIKTLFDKSEADAALVPEPWGSRLVKEVKASIVLDYKQVFRNGKYPSTVIVARTEFLKQHPELVTKFLKAHINITNYLNKNKAKAKDIVNDEILKLTKKSLSKDVLDSSFKRIDFTYDIEKDPVNDFAGISYSLGFLKEKPNIKNLFDDSFLKKAKK